MTTSLPAVQAPPAAPVGHRTEDETGTRVETDAGVEAAAAAVHYTRLASAVGQRDLTPVELLVLVDLSNQVSTDIPHELPAQVRTEGTPSSGALGRGPSASVA